MNIMTETKSCVYAKAAKTIVMLMCMVLMFGMMPVFAYGATGGDLGGQLYFSDTSDTTGVSYDSAARAYVVSSAGIYTVNNKSNVEKSGDRIKITAPSGTVTLRLNGINIEGNAAGIECDGACTTRLVLVDGTTNTLKGMNKYPGIINYEHSLVIDGESGNTGKLIALGNNGEGGQVGVGYTSAGIGGSEFLNDSTMQNKSGALSGSNITINGGIIEATGYGGCAGIGAGSNNVNSGLEGKCQNVIINGGTVTAKGGDYGGGSGIGAQKVDGITINGGTVNATGGKQAAGIGGTTNSVEVKNIKITGGSVTATGGSYDGYSADFGGAGIGGGVRNTWKNDTLGNVDGVIISGGTVNATGGYNAAGIGGGTRGNCKNVTISGGTVVASLFG